MDMITNFESNFIGGEFVNYRGPMMDVINPATERAIAAVPDAGGDVVDAAVSAAKTAQPSWESTPAIARAAYLKAIAAKLRAHSNDLARCIVQEQGKVTPLAEFEVALTAEYFEYMAEWARRIEGEIISSDRPGENILLFRRPMGVVAGILPWNFPLFMIARKMAPALVTGNTVVIKPSEETPLSAVMFAKLVAEVSLPKGVFNLVLGSGRSAGAALAGHPGIDMVSFTGSTEAGKSIYASAARNITKVSLELGGKAPIIVMDDADIDLAVGTVTASKAINSGQACNCPERAYVHEEIVQQFTDKLATAMKTISYGDPSGARAVQMGPLINGSAVKRLDRLVADAKSKGASIVSGGRIGDGPGFHFEPTVVVGTRVGMDIMREEIFGPVVVINPIASLEEGIERANDSDYGLTSSIFTTNLQSALRACRDLRFGETYINRENVEAIQGFHAGLRKSGVGGADGKHGVYEFLSTHVVYVS
jgi:lactaldehyde dehydrogenase/glycolaldehyde dehydrogenase